MIDKLCSGHTLTPFGLSLSKACSFFCLGAGREKQGFDKLSPDGVWDRQLSEAK